MTINKLLIDFDRTFSDITNKLSESVREEFTNNQVDFCLNVGTENIEGMFSDLPDGPGIYFFEVGFKDLYQQEINVFKDPDAWNESGKTEFEVKKSYFYGILNQIWNELEEIDRGRGESYPKIIKKRFDFHFNKNTSKNSFENDDWVPFYIGKHKNIKYRVLEHIKRSGMKLADFITVESVFCDFPIRVSMAVIPDTVDGRRFILVEETERILREELQPLVGKQ